MKELKPGEAELLSWAAETEHKAERLLKEVKEKGRAKVITITPKVSGAVAADKAEPEEEPKKPERGSLYLRGDTYWVKYYKHGKPYRESAKTDNYDKALRFLKYKQKQIELGRFVEPKLERTAVSELWEPFLRDLRLYKRKDISHVERRWEKHLEPVFSDMRAIDVTKTRLLEYVDQRQKEGAETSTIARELAVLKRMFRLGYSADPQMVTKVPSFPKLQECTPRQGFLADADYPKLANECARQGLWLRAMLAVAYNFGWRKSELLNLRVRQVDLALRVIRLDAGSTKNNDSRRPWLAASRSPPNRRPQFAPLGRGPENHSGNWRLEDGGGVPALQHHRPQRPGRSRPTAR